MTTLGAFSVPINDHTGLGSLVAASQTLRFFGYFQTQFFNARTDVENGLVVKQNPLALQPSRLFV
jgi:hypothetical protein